MDESGCHLRTSGKRAQHATRLKRRCQDVPCQPGPWNDNPRLRHHLGNRCETQTPLLRYRDALEYPGPVRCHGAAHKDIRLPAADRPGGAVTRRPEVVLGGTMPVGAISELATATKYSVRALRGLIPCLTPHCRLDAEQSSSACMTPTGIPTDGNRGIGRSRGGTTTKRRRYSQTMIKFVFIYMLYLMYYFPTQTTSRYILRSRSEASPQHISSTECRHEPGATLRVDVTSWKGQMREDKPGHGVRAK